jgi:hypothetical protein
MGSFCLAILLSSSGRIHYPIIVAFACGGSQQAKLHTVPSVQLLMPLAQGTEERIGHLQVVSVKASDNTAMPLEHGHRVVENLLNGHHSTSLRRCSVQKTVWESGRPFGRM